MELNFSSNLFLGKEELNHFKKSLGEKGFKRMFQNLIKTYGVVKLDSDTAFSALKVVAGTANGQLSINSGSAVNSDINVIEVTSNLVDNLTVAGDNVTRYVVAKFADSNVQGGTVSISATGQVTGVGTKFTETLRGLPNFPSVVTFNGSVNTGEYKVASVINDTNMQLNIAAGLLTAEAAKTYSVVGTFSPGYAIPAASKFPISSDNYTITLETALPVATGTDFVLATVTNNGTTTTIGDLRSNNILSMSGDVTEELQANPLTTLKSVSYKVGKATGDELMANFEWSFNIGSGNWTTNATSKVMTVTAGSGGAWPSKASFTNGAWDGWYVYYITTGTKVKISQSVLNGADIDLTLVSSSPASGTESIRIVPPGMLMEVELTGGSGPVFKTVPIDEGYVKLEAEANITHGCRYRILSPTKQTATALMNPSTYTNELLVATAFNGNTFTTVVKAESVATWDEQWTAATPTMTIQGNPITTSTLIFRWIKKGKTVHGTIEANITAADADATKHIIELSGLPFSYPTATNVDVQNGAGSFVQNATFAGREGALLEFDVNSRIRMQRASGAVMPSGAFNFFGSFTFEIA